jgi:Uma2 family endonuclease
LQATKVGKFSKQPVVGVYSFLAGIKSFINYVLSPEFFNKPSIRSFPVPTQKHDDIVSDLQGNLFIAIQNRDFRVYCQTTLVYIPIRALVSETENYREPDIVLLSKSEGKRNALHQVINPLVIMELLSPSTQAKDRLDKVEEYQSIDSLQQYIIVWQDRMKVVVYTKIEKNRWEQQTLSQPTDQIHFLPIGYLLSLDSVYEGVI